MIDNFLQIKQLSSVVQNQMVMISTREHKMNELENNLRARQDSIDDRDEEVYI